MIEYSSPRQSKGPAQNCTCSSYWRGGTSQKGKIVKEISKAKYAILSIISEIQLAAVLFYKQMINMQLKGEGFNATLGPDENKLFEC